MPIVTASALFDFAAWGDALLMFFAFCCTASAIYVVNDLTDLAADRQHQRKRHRPFASGALPLYHGPIVVPGLLLAGESWRPLREPSMSWCSTPSVRCSTPSS